MVGPAHRRQAARAVVKRRLCSGRAACRILRLSRATFWYQGRPPTPAQVRLAKRLRVLSEARPCVVGQLKMLTILDEHTRECHVLRPERALRAADVLAWLARAIHEHGAPAFLRRINGPEFIAKEV